jgi:hypothetical protein
MTLDRTAAFRINQARADGWGEQAEAFVAWQDALNAIVESNIGLTVHDLPDWDFASAFETGTSPRDAAREFLDDLSRECDAFNDDYL